MSGINMRMTPQDPRFFSPDRDLAYCTPHLVHRAVLGLDPEHQEPWIKKFLAAQNITSESLIDGARILAEYMNKALLDPKYKHPYEALLASGFFDLPDEVQVVILAKIGQVFLSGFFTAIRDVLRDPNDPPASLQKIADAATTLQESAAKYRAAPAWRKYLYRAYLRAREYVGI